MYDVLLFVTKNTLKKKVTKIIKLKIINDNMFKNDNIFTCLF